MDSIRLIIITVPSVEIQTAINAFRTPLCQMVQSKEALTYPPHVTLRTGVIVPGDSMPAFIKDFGEVVNDIDPFPLETNGLGYGKYYTQLTSEPGAPPVEKYYIYFRIKPSTPLMALHQRLLYYQKYKKGNQAYYEPHLTLVYDDLTYASYLLLIDFLDSPRDKPITRRQYCQAVAR